MKGSASRNAKPGSSEPSHSVSSLYQVVIVGLLLDRAQGCHQALAVITDHQSHVLITTTSAPQGTIYVKIVWVADQSGAARSREVRDLRSRIHPNLRIGLYWLT